MAAIEQDFKKVNKTDPDWADEASNAVSDTTRQQNILKLRYEALLAPTFSIFEQLSALTFDVPPQTSHEAWFQSAFKQVRCSFQ